MTTYTTLTDAELTQDQPITQAKMRALRDNPLAIQEGDATAPKITNSAFSDNTLGAEKFQEGTEERDWIRTLYAQVSSGSVGTHYLMRNVSGGNVSAGATTAGSNLDIGLGSAAGSWSADAVTVISGTWRNLGTTLANSEYGLFLRVS